MYTSIRNTIYYSVLCTSYYIIIHCNVMLCYILLGPALEAHGHLALEG